MPTHPEPTDQEVAEEIAKLQKLKPTTITFSAFGDDHHAAMEAQIDVLQSNMSEDEAIESYMDSGENVESAARDAAMWLIGEAEDGVPPSSSWEDLQVK